MKKLTVLGLILVLILIVGCSKSTYRTDEKKPAMQIVQQDRPLSTNKEEVEWIFCKSYSPGGRGGMLPGDHSFYSHVLLKDKLFQVNWTSISDTYPSDEGLNELREVINDRIDYYMAIDSVQFTEEGIIINDDKFTKELDKPCCDYGTRGGCISSEGKTVEEVKSFFLELMT